MKEYENEDFEDLEDDDEDLEDEDLEDEVEEDEDEDTEEDTSNNGGGEKEDIKTETTSAKPKQSPQKNEFYKNLRLAHKEEADIRADERRKVLLDSVNHINPYTNKPIVDEEDEEEFFTMREIENKGKNPIEDYSEYVKEQKRETKRTQQTTFDTKNDLIEFKTAYPNVDVSNLINDQDFLKRYGFALGKVSLKELYEAFEGYKNDVKVIKNDLLVKKRTKANPGPQSSRKELSLKDVETLRYDSKEFEELLERAKRGDLTAD